MKKILLQMKAPEWSQGYILIFKTPRAAISVVVDWILPKFYLINAFMVILVTCKNEVDTIVSGCGLF